MGALAKIIDVFPVAQKAMKPFEEHIAGMPYPENAMAMLRNAGCDRAPPARAFPLSLRWTLERVSGLPFL